MLDIEEQIRGYVDEVEIDFISMAEIAENVAFDLGTKDLGKIRIPTMIIVEALMKRGIWPGDYTPEALEGDGFSFFPGTLDDLAKRINKEWVALNRMPEPDDICWFALKPSDKA